MFLLAILTDQLSSVELYLQLSAKHKFVRFSDMLVICVEDNVDFDLPDWVDRNPRNFILKWVPELGMSEPELINYHYYGLSVAAQDLRKRG